MDTSILSKYELERNKLLPNLEHALIQGNLIFLLNLHYRDRFMFPSELSLDTTPGSTPGSTPDISIYPLKKIDRRKIEARAKEAPLTTIEIQSPSQSIDELQKIAWELYFPMGVQSAWIVIPALKALQIIFPDDSELFFKTGVVKDPTIQIEIELEEVFRGL